MTVPTARLSPGWAAGFALGAGLLGVLAFPRPGVWWLAPVSVALLSLAVTGQPARRSAWIGLIYGAAFFGPLLHWTSTFVGSAPWLILAAAEAAYFAGLGPLLMLAARHRFAPLSTACLWVAQEALRGRAPFGGFPWGRLAFSQADSPLRWFAALGGAPLVSAAVALAGGLLAIAGQRAVLGTSRWPALPARRLVAAGVAGAAAVVLTAAALSIALAPGSGDRTLNVALVQGNVPDRGLEFNERRRQVLDNHVQATLALARSVQAGNSPAPDLVLWPENASDIDPFGNPDAYAEIQNATDAVGVPILVGAILDGPGEDHVSNVGILWFPGTGPGQRYTKRHPVPFGEYIPLRDLARAVSDKVDLVERDMVAGSGNGVISGGPVPLGDVICFEVAYDALVRSSVRAGAQILVVQTNNATFGHSAETYQQLAMSRLRAVEHGRTVLQVATSGKSAVIGPDGQIVSESGALFTRAVLSEAVAIRTTDTLATRLGSIPEWLMTAAGLLAVSQAAAQRLLRRRMGPDLRADERVTT